MQNKKLTTVIILLAMVALTAGIWLQQRILSKRESQLAGGSVFSVAKNIAPFELVDSKGIEFTNANLQGHWSLMFFGFTRCPSLCPTTLAVLSQVYKTLSAAKYPILPQVIFVSVDPEIDELEDIDEYVAAFDPHFIGVTGDLIQLQQLTNQLGVTFEKVYAENDSAHQGKYVINHSGAIIVFNPTGKLHAVLTMPHTADRITKDFRILTTQFKG
jgi:protein SCO1